MTDRRKRDTKKERKEEKRKETRKKERKKEKKRLIVVGQVNLNVIRSS